MPLEASAGRDAKEDVIVSLRLGVVDGIQIELKSSVQTLYGEQQKKILHDTAIALGLKDVLISVEDKGALDWVIQARLETAVRRLVGRDDCTVKESLPAKVSRHDYSIDRQRMRRTRLYLPGNQPDLMINAGLFSPDGIILDLEDSVAPSQKDAARILVRNALRAIDFCGVERMVRINQLPFGLDDLSAIIPQGVHTLLIPKAEKVEDVLAVVSKVQSLTDRTVFLMPILESALGVEHALEIASAHPWVVALTFGAEDFTRDICASRTEAGTESFVARSRVVMAARAAGVQPIDTVYSDVQNEAGLLASTREAISLGFEGKGCIHPRQISIINEAFRPTENEVIYALKVKQAIKEAEERGQGVISIGSKMIDPPVVARALRVIQLAKLYQMSVMSESKEVLS